MPSQTSLRDRAAGRPGTDVARRPDNAAAPVTLKQQIQRMESEFSRAMPKGLEATQLVRDAQTAISKNPKLLECDATSVLGSLMTCAQLGLRVGVLGQAWILPFRKGGGTSQAQLIIGYQGIVELAHRSGKIESLIARIVYENDEFDVSYGLDDRLVHKPTPWGEEPGKPIGYYAIVKLTTGGRAFFAMSKEDAEKHREKHAMARDRRGNVVGPWRDHFDAMALKTCVLKLAKWMPKSTEMSVAMQADEGIRFDVSPDVDAAAAGVTHRPAAELDAGEDPTEILLGEIRTAAAEQGVEIETLPALFAERFNGLHIDGGDVHQLQDFLTAVRAGTYSPEEPAEE